MRYRRWLRYGLPAVLLVLGLTSRVLFAGRCLGEWDEVDFALALRDYDMVAQQPHFPGYPVYVWLSWVSTSLVKDEVYASSLISALFGGMAVLPFYYLALSMFTRRIAVLAALFFLTNPACWLYSERPLSEATALFFLLLSLHLLFLGMGRPVYQLTPLLGALFMGVTLGARLDYLPFLSGLFYLLTYNYCEYKIYGIFCILGAFVLGVMVWFIPFVNTVGSDVLLHQALDFTRGHFSDWGGSIATTPNPVIRLGHLLWDMFPAGLGFWWIDLSCTLFIPSLCLLYGLYAFLKGDEHSRQRRFIFVIFFPYLVWIFFAQNVEKPRHVLPLIPLLLVAASAGILQKGVSPIIQAPKRMHKLGLLVLTVITLGTFSLRLVYHYSKTRPPLMELVCYLTTTSFDQLSTRLYCGESKRLFEYYAPGWDARRVRNWEGLRYDLRASLCPPPNLLVTSEVIPGRRCLETAGLREVKRFEGERYIYTPYHAVALFAVDSHGL